MREYMLVQVCPFNNKKEKEYKPYEGKIFKMNDILYLGSPVYLEFENKTLKSKLESITKEKEVNPRKRLVMVTSDFTAIIQLREMYDKEVGE